MAGDLPRHPSATPKGQNPEGQNLENIAGTSRVPEPEIPHRPGKGLVQPEEPVTQDHTKGGNDQGYYEDDYYPTAAKLEIERLKQ